MHSVRLILYGTSGCHLCDEALEETRKAIKEFEENLSIKLEAVDIIEDDLLFEKYQTTIPVLNISSAHKSYAINWPFDNEKIIKLLNEFT